MTPLELRKENWLKISLLATCDEARLDNQVALVGLDPRIDFQNRLLVGVDLRGADLANFDFTYSDLSGAVFDTETTFDETTVLTGAKLDKDLQEFFGRVPNPPALSLCASYKEIALSHGDYRARLHALEYYLLQTGCSISALAFAETTILIQKKNAPYLVKFHDIIRNAKLPGNTISSVLAKSSVNGKFDISPYDIVSDDVRVLLIKAIDRSSGSTGPGKLKNIFQSNRVDSGLDGVAVERLENDSSVLVRRVAAEEVYRRTISVDSSIQELLWNRFEAERDPIILEKIFLIFSKSDSIWNDFDSFFDLWCQKDQTKKKAAMMALGKLSGRGKGARKHLLGIANSSASKTDSVLARTSLLSSLIGGSKTSSIAIQASKKQVALRERLRRRKKVFQRIADTEFYAHHAESDNLKKIFKDDKDHDVEIDREALDIVRSTGISLGV